MLSNRRRRGEAKRRPAVEAAYRGAGENVGAKACLALCAHHRQAKSAVLVH